MGGQGNLINRRYGLFALDCKKLKCRIRNIITRNWKERRENAFSSIEMSLVTRARSFLGEQHDSIYDKNIANFPICLFLTKTYLFQVMPSYEERETIVSASI